MVAVWMFRHGETLWNQDRRLQGQLDIPLSDTGLRQARAMIQLLHELELNAIYSSDLMRAYSTAVVLADALSLPLHQHAGFREVHQGQAQGRLVSEIDDLFGKDAWYKWNNADPQYWGYSLPQAETKQDALQRAVQAIEELDNQYKYDRVAICSHGFLMNLLAFVHGEKPDNAIIQNGELWQLKKTVVSGIRQ